MNPVTVSWGSSGLPVGAAVDPGAALSVKTPEVIDQVAMRKGLTDCVQTADQLRSRSGIDGEAVSRPVGYTDQLIYEIDTEHGLGT